MANKVCAGISVLIGVIAIVAISIITKSMTKLESTEVGLRYEPLTKELSDIPTYEGLYIGTPGFGFVTVPSFFTTETFTYIQCLSKDGIEIKLIVSYQFKIDSSYLKSVIMQFRDFENYKYALWAFVRSSVHDACSQFLTQEFQTRRGAFQKLLRGLIVDKFALIHSSIADLQVQDILRPKDYENSVKSKEEAREDIDVANSAHPKRITAAKTVEKQAETEANITLNDAETSARIIISKAMVDAEAILNAYKQETESYTFLMSEQGLNMDVDSFLSYMTVRALENSPNAVQVGIDYPPKTP